MLFIYTKNDKKKQKKKKEKEPPYSTYQLLEKGKNAFNDQIVPRQSIASTWRPISQREKYDNPYQEVDPQQKHYYNRILEYLQQILDSKEARDYLEKLLETELEIPTDNIQDFYEYISTIEDGTIFMQTVLFMCIPSSLVFLLEKWKQHVLMDIHDEQTNFSSIDPVLHEKDYVFTGNYDETTDEINGSFYGIHLIQHSDELVHLYTDEEHITNDNLISGTYSYTLRDVDYPDNTRIFTTTCSRKNMSPFFIEADEYFTKLITKKRAGYEFDHVIKLSEIIAFFAHTNHDVLNIIDTGCRNLDAEKTKHLSHIQLLDKTLHITKKRHVKVRKTPFNKELGKKNRKSMRKQVYKNKNSAIGC